MGSKDAPDAPDYRGAAEEQAQSSAEVTNMQTYANRPNQNTPWGSTSWSTEGQIDPATGQQVTGWTQDMTLNPESQRALDSALSLQADRSGLAGSMYGQMADEFGQPIDFGSASPLQGAPGVSGAPGITQQEQLQRGLSTEGLTNLDPSQRYYDDAEQAIYGQYERRAEPRMANQKAAMETQLRNQGLNPGSEAYDYQLNQLMQQQEDSRMGAQYQATMGAGQEAQRMLGMDAATRGQMFGERGAQGQFANQAAGQQFGMGAQQFGQGMQAGAQDFGQGMQGAAFGNQVRQQQISEEMQRRGYTLNEINAILTGQQVQQPNMPGFENAGRSEATQYNQAAQSQGQADLDRFNAEQMATQGMMSGIGAIGGGFMPG